MSILINKISIQVIKYLTKYNHINNKDIVENIGINQVKLYYCYMCDDKQNFDLLYV